MARLRQWCLDATEAVGDLKYSFIYVDQESFERHQPKTFAALVSSFTEYKS
jgi:type III restriction enzyme